MKPITERESEVVYGHIVQDQSGFAENPCQKAAAILLTSFGWSLSQARIRAKAVILGLEKSGKLECRYGARKRILAVTAVNTVSRKGVVPRLVKSVTEPEPQPEPEVVSETGTDDAAGQASAVAWYPVRRKLEKEVRRPRKKFKKGAARIKRRNEIVGERNEQRLFYLMTELLSQLQLRYPEVVTHTSCTRSGRHNPKKGNIDLQDHWGEDVTPRLTVRTQDLHTIEGFLIYDSKTSSRYADNFNRNVRYFPGQIGALLKKAIVVNKKRTDREIAREIMEDMISVRLLRPEMLDILEFFSDS